MTAAFQSADMIYFAGRGRVSRTISLWTCSFEQILLGQLFSHVAYIVEDGGKPVLVESTTLCDLDCERQRKPVKGPQVHDPWRRINAYNGRVWRCRLSERLSKWQSETLAEFAFAKMGEGYDVDGALLAGTHWLKFSRWIRPDPANLFCSRYAMEGLRKARVVDQDLNPATYSPAAMQRDLQWWGTYQWLGAKGSQSIRVK